MRYFLGIFLIFLFSACTQNDNVSKNKANDEEVVQIEQNDEKTELNENNLPLPIEDDINQSLQGLE
ncbi:cytochrome C [Campylobacter sp. US33a]|uniref:cytochrome C n=1 Tax=Campylobacter sp. US33a TaxID=2498120 RepID=UPI00106880B8|nr:cytochrome C [Campylobacter sp. US33a]TEY03068.1 cytochrome C [Campylobacter sp. US33a]